MRAAAVYRRHRARRGLGSCDMRSGTCSLRFRNRTKDQVVRGRGEREHQVECTYWSVWGKRLGRNTLERQPRVFEHAREPLTKRARIAPELGGNHGNIS